MQQYLIKPTRPEFIAALRTGEVVQVIETCGSTLRCWVRKSGLKNVRVGSDPKGGYCAIMLKAARTKRVRKVTK